MIISGRDIAAQLHAQMRQQVDNLAVECGRAPGLTILQVGDDPASTIYVRNKLRAATNCHIDARLIHLPADISEQELCDKIATLNSDDQVDGILVQLPLPAPINEQRVIRAILPEKDADGFHPDGHMIACTSKGILALLASTGVDLRGKHVVMVGDTDVVGSSMAKLLTDRQCTVAVAQTDTPDLPSVCRRADILIAAVDSPRFITPDHIRQGAIVIDAGCHHMADGTVTGDVDFEACKDRASFITPVPGGVGVMIVAMLMQNTIECFLRRIDK